MPNKLILGRPVDKTLAAYKEWILGIAEQLTGKRTDDLTPEEWQADWRAFWAGTDAERHLDLPGVT